MFLGIATPKMQKKFLYVNVEGTAVVDTSHHTVASVMFLAIKTVPTCTRRGIFSRKFE